MYDRTLSRALVAKFFATGFQNVPDVNQALL